MSRASRAVAILGAGTQGRRLAFMWSNCGRPVNLIDRDEKQLQASIHEVNTFRSTFPKFKTAQEWGKVSKFPYAQLREALSNAWLVLECLPESLQLKRRIIAELEQHAPENAILASNSSSYTIGEIIAGVQLKRPERTVSMHSYWPPETCPLEIMGHDETDPDIIPSLLEESARHGFQPFHVRRESVGYLYNRVWAAIKREALLTLSEGVSTLQELDDIFKAVLKTPKGPCEQMDVVGLDVVLDIEEHYAQTRSGIPQAPRDLLKQMVAEGNLGVKSGQGFYKY
ncbi:3-hydroxyacyl-CoA dehydrogenase [Lophiostoma macrostomum CBS 122681]|uniref:3-hydroxyacyl-CoA dehydrogenase n=1 Tax=Lophiostoma macrostomum CBS 122681 TaxID=1314788 RepID=A0A6A6SQC0_9PLEO|nr:3-hydroxyacyl-CoA dehydrogenase [Lophiostoma macrostomum CBS 122681]